MAIVQVLENALKYSPDSARVALKIEVAASDLKISVHNDGSYIPPSERELVFERYYRSPSVKHGAPGTGIGLSVSKRAIEAQSGRIWIESGEETGTTFTISVPIEEDQK
jgi:two-component system sensor histidine kinase KdpD